MKKRLIFTFGIIALLGLVGCERQPERVTTQPLPHVSTSPRLEETSRQSWPTAPNPGATSVPIVAVGLIPSQSPEQRLPQVERGRANPFEPPVQPPSIRAKAPFAPPKSLPRLAPASRSSPPQDLALPPQVIPAPVEAQGIYVTGIIELGKSPVAIVQVLGEASEQSVEVGSRLAAGLVEVVAVDAQTQTVTLKQYGQLVSRKLGDAPSSTSIATSAPKL